MADLLLSGSQPELVAWLLEKLFREAGQRGVVIPAELRRLAAETALAAAPSAVRMPMLLRAIGPQEAAAVKVQVARLAASADDGTEQDRARSELLLPAGSSLPASEAARIAGVSVQAIRAACVSARLSAAKDKITGQWRISRPDLAEWMEGRRAA
jgi:hypothetical protein